MRRSIVTVLMLIIGVFVLSGISTLAQDDVAQANKAALLSALDEGNTGNWQAFYDLIAETFMMNEGDDQLYEHAQGDVIGYNEMLLVGMPDMQANADVVVAQGDWVAAEITWSGTFTNSTNFFGEQLEPTNETVLWTEMDFMQFEDGKIVTLWALSDPMVMLGQMGMFPPMEDDGTSGTLMDSPAGYQTLSADELAATFTSGMEERNLGSLQAQLEMGLGTDDSDFYTDEYISWDSGQAVAYLADVQVEEDMAFTGMIATAMPDYVIETPVVVAEGDWVATLVKVSGTFTADTDFFGMPLTATGEPVTWLIGMTQRYNADGRIVEVWNETDATSLFVGLGLMSMDEE